MKRFLPFVALLVLGACSEQPMQADNVVTPRFAMGETTNTRRPFAGEFFNPCNGELVTLSGYIHETFSFHTDNAGGTHIKVHSNPQGVSGVSASGVKYVANGATNSSLMIKPGAAQTEHFNNVFNVIAQGKTPNFKVHELMHVTLNANGEPTAVVFKFDVTCK